MIRSTKNVILFSAFMYLVVLGVAGVEAQTGLQQRIDSLFVIASSGEIKYQTMVEPAIDSIAAIGAEAVPVLVDKFTTKSARERLTITNILKKIGQPAVPYLIESLNSPEGLVVERVCGTLGDIADSAAVSALTKAALHVRWQVREQALGALGDIRDSRGTETITNGLQDSIGEVRKAAAVAAGALKTDEVLPALVHMLGDDFYGARMSAAGALLKLDTPQVVQAAVDSLGSENELVGNLGCYVLGKLGTDTALEHLLAQARSDNPSRRAHAAVAFIRSDSTDSRGLRDSLLAAETDRLVRLKIESAIAAVKNVQ